MSELDEKLNLDEIQSVILEAITESPHYQTGTPTALIHLATHLVGAIGAIKDRLEALEAQEASR